MVARSTAYCTKVWCWNSHTLKDHESPKISLSEWVSFSEVGPAELALAGTSGGFLYCWACWISAQSPSVREISQVGKTEVTKASERQSQERERERARLVFHLHLIWMFKCDQGWRNCKPTDVACHITAPLVSPISTFWPRHGRHYVSRKTKQLPTNSYKTGNKRHHRVKPKTKMGITGVVRKDKTSRWQSRDHWTELTSQTTGQNVSLS